MTPFREEGGLRFSGSCLFCEAIFIAKKRHKKYCSASCRELHGRQRRGTHHSIERLPKAEQQSDFDKKLEAFALAFSKAEAENNTLVMTNLLINKKRFIAEHKKSII